MLISNVAGAWLEAWGGGGGPWPLCLLQVYLQVSPPDKYLVLSHLMYVRYISSIVRQTAGTHSRPILQKLCLSVNSPCSRYITPWTSRRRTSYTSLTRPNGPMLYSLIHSLLGYYIKKTFSLTAEENALEICGRQEEFLGGLPSMEKEGGQHVSLPTAPKFCL